MLGDPSQNLPPYALLTDETIYSVRVCMGPNLKYHGGGVGGVSMQQTFPQVLSTTINTALP